MYEYSYAREGTLYTIPGGIGLLHQTVRRRQEGKMAAPSTLSRDTIVTSRDNIFFWKNLVNLVNLLILGKNLVNLLGLRIAQF